MTRQSYEYEISRRGFVATVVAFLGSIISAFIALPGVGYLLSPGLTKRAEEIWVPLGPADDLIESIPKLYTFTQTKRIGWEATGISYGVYVIRHASGELDVFSNVCTHLSCRYTFREDLDHFFCACHGGHFAKDGSVLAGPPPRPLDRLDYKIEDEIIYVHLVTT